MTDIPNIQPDSRATTILEAPDKTVSVRELFGFDVDPLVAHPHPFDHGGRCRHVLRQPQGIERDHAVAAGEPEDAGRSPPPAARSCTRAAARTSRGLRS